MEKSFIALPERPGLGVEMSDAAARQTHVQGTRWLDPMGRG